MVNLVGGSISAYRVYMIDDHYLLMLTCSLTTYTYPLTFDGESHVTHWTGRRVGGSHCG